MQAFLTIQHPKFSQVQTFALGRKNRKGIDLQCAHIHDAPYAVTLFHVLEGGVDLPQRLSVGDELIHFQLASQIIIHETWELRAAFDTPKRTPLPDSTSHQLERY